ncbi:hypothetical protein JHK87_024413 [Glycine soja]|nr:hypothetical protein JHK87_024413 [Glycine soja]
MEGRYGGMGIMATTTLIWVPTNPRGAERLPPGKVNAESDLFLRRLWGLPSELLLIIRATKARKVSLLATPLTVEVAERLGFANHIIEEAQLLKKSREVADAIVKTNQDLVLRYKAVINDGLKLDLGRALSLKNGVTLTQR